MRQACPKRARKFLFSRAIWHISVLYNSYQSTLPHTSMSLFPTSLLSIIDNQYNILWKKHVDIQSEFSYSLPVRKEYLIKSHIKTANMRSVANDKSKIISTSKKRVRRSNTLVIPAIDAISSYLQVRMTGFSRIMSKRHK